MILIVKNREKETKTSEHPKNFTVQYSTSQLLCNRIPFLLKKKGNWNNHIIMFPSKSYDLRLKGRPFNFELFLGC